VCCFGHYFWIISSTTVTYCGGIRAEIVLNYAEYHCNDNEFNSSLSFQQRK